MDYNNALDVPSTPQSMEGYLEEVEAARIKDVATFVHLK